jgi:hypothetical protein
MFEFWRQLRNFRSKPPLPPPKILEEWGLTTVPSLVQHILAHSFTFLLETALFCSREMHENSRAVKPYNGSSVDIEWLKRQMGLGRTQTIILQMQMQISYAEELRLLWLLLCFSPFLGSSWVDMLCTVTLSLFPSSSSLMSEGKLWMKNKLVSQKQLGS